MKSLLKAAVLCVLAVGLAVSALVALKLDDLLKTAIVDFGPRVTKTSIAVSSLHVSPLLGSARVDGLAVGNPKGFSSAKAFEAERVRARLRTNSLWSDTIVVDLVEVDGAKVSLEGKGSASNLGRIEQNANAFAAELQGKLGSKATPAAKPSGPSKKLLIKKLVLKGAKATVRYGLISGDALSVDLPDIELRDIGTGGGSAVSELVARVTRAVQETVAKTAAKPLKEIGSTVQDLGKGIGRELGGLFGKKKK